jgi:AraC-like DNA-binding protein
VNTLLAIGAVNAGLLAAMVARKNDRVVADRGLMVLLLALSGTYALVFVARLLEESAWLLPLVYSNLVFGPLLLLYVTSMSGPVGSPPKRWRTWFLPGALAYFYLSWIVLSSSEAQIDLAFSQRDLSVRPPLAKLFYFVDLVALPICLLMSWRRLRVHARWVAENYSYRRDVDLAWMRRLVVAICALWAVVDLPLLGALWTTAPSDETLLTIGMSLGSVLVLYLGFHGARQVHLREVGIEEVSAPDSPRYEHSGMSVTEVEVYRARLLEVMVRDRPHLSRTLNLAELGGMVGLSPHNLSEVINSALDQTFYDFVNTRRVEEFQRRATADEVARRTLLDIAIDCGFNSKSSFNRIFKQQVGCTPSDYLKSRSA